MIDAGADSFVGNHAHWAGAWRSGRADLVCPRQLTRPDLVKTEEGILLELTFSGLTPVQARLLPTIILDASQPNLLIRRAPARCSRSGLQRLKRLPAW
jgi:hypothetical protein